MPKSLKSKRKINIEKTSDKNSIWDVFRFGESYTSLILGILVVVIATILLLTFVNKDKNISSQRELAKNTQQEQNLPTKSVAKPTVTRTQTLLTPTSQPSKPTPTVKNVKSIVSQQNSISGSNYTVAKGDTLWSISERKYKSGYNWVDIQKANNLTNPDVIAVGTKLTLPKTATKILTEQSNNANEQIVSSNQKSKITGSTYTIVKGDTLWDISIRAYADGYAWPKIARANNLPNPDLIYPDNKLIIPRN